MLRRCCFGKGLTGRRSCILGPSWRRDGRWDALRRTVAGSGVNMPWGFRSGKDGRGTLTCRCLLRPWSTPGKPNQGPFICPVWDQPTIEHSPPATFYGFDAPFCRMKAFQDGPKLTVNVSAGLEVSATNEEHAEWPNTRVDIGMIRWGLGRIYPLSQPNTRVRVLPSSSHWFLSEADLG